jgi:hypothetical protein
MAYKEYREQSAKAIWYVQSVCGQMTVEKRKGSKKFSHDRQYPCNHDDSDDEGFR